MPAEHWPIWEGCLASYKLRSDRMNVKLTIFFNFFYMKVLVGIGLCRPCNFCKYIRHSLKINIISYIILKKN